MKILFRKYSLLFFALICTSALATGPVSANAFSDSKVVNDRTTDLVPLHDAEQMRSKLLAAFGGRQMLRNVNSFTADLEIDRPDNTPQKSRTFVNFRQTQIVRANRLQKELIIIDSEQSVLVSKGKKMPLPEERKSPMLRNMKLNFLYFLRSPDLKLIGPLGKPEDTDLTWWKLQSGNDQSPALGLNPENGQIRKVHFPDGKVVVESDYQTLDSGIIWPHKFQLFDNQESILEGTYSNVKVNKDADLEALSKYAKGH